MPLDSKPRYMFTYRSRFWGPVKVEWISDRSTVLVSARDTSGLPFFSGGIDWVASQGGGVFLSPEEVENIKFKVVEMLMDAS